MSDPGRVEAIWIKRARRGPMELVDRATLVAGRGLEGNANQGGKRQVTLICRHAWDEVQAALGEAVDPSHRRANLMVRGVRLRETRDRLLAVGDALVLIHGETTPCRRMDEEHPGLQDALRPAWRGGAYGAVERGGQVRVGDRVAWADDAAPPAAGPPGREAGRPTD